MTAETRTQAPILHHTQETAFAKHTTGSWKGPQEINDDTSFSTAPSSISASPDMSSTPLSPITSRSSSSLTSIHLPPYIGQDHQYPHHRDQEKHCSAAPRGILPTNASIIDQLMLRIRKQEREIAALQVCLTVTHQKWEEQVERADEAVRSQQQAENEIEELSTQLFEQANEMVATERRERYAANEQTENIIRELEHTRELLQREQLLRSRIAASPDPARNTPIMDTHSLTLFRDFVQRVRSVSLDHVQRLPFMKLCLEQDIYPCLQRMKKLSSRRLLNSLARRPCYIERKTTSIPPNTTEPCFACGGLQRRNQQDFEFRVNDNDKCWHRIDKPCKDRLAAISNFYEFIRHLHISLQGHQHSIENLFHKMVWLRLYLFWTRSGIIIDDNISAESVVVSISKLFDARSYLL